MQLTFTTGAAVLLALASSVRAGTARVVNACGSPVYYAAVGAGGTTNMQLLPAGGFSQSFTGSGSGVSIKLAPAKTGPHTQFEFTMTGSKVAYDMSNIDGYPFSAGGMQLMPSMKGDTSNPTCVPVTCLPGQAHCDAAYNNPDDVRTLVCNSATDLTLTLCIGGSQKREEIEVSEVLPGRIHARHLPKLA